MMTFRDWLALAKDAAGGDWCDLDGWPWLGALPETWDVALPYKIVATPRAPLLEETERPLSFGHAYKRMCRAVFDLSIRRPDRVAQVIGITAGNWGGQTIHFTTGG